MWGGDSSSASFAALRRHAGHGVESWKAIRNINLGADLGKQESLRLSRRRNSTAHSANLKKPSQFAATSLSSNPSISVHYVYSALRLLISSVATRLIEIAKQKRAYSRKLSDPYERLYYTAILYERRGKSAAQSSDSCLSHCYPFSSTRCICTPKPKSSVPLEMMTLFFAGTAVCACSNTPMIGRVSDRRASRSEAYDTAPPR